MTFDGEAVVGERGEPVAAALIGEDKLVVARSPKFHRPRGPSCLRAACDGCLARVDDTPNVMTCMTAAAEGMTIVTQNRLGPREADLLRMTDWFFPEGMNHHELFAGVPGVQTVMQAFARRVAGLGKLPAEEAAPRRATRRKADVVVVGGGPSGMAIAVRLAERGRKVEVLDDQLAPGGGVLALGPDDAAAFATIRASFAKLAGSGAIAMRSRTYAGGVYGRDLLVVGENGAEILEADDLVLACGAHDGVLAFEGNDVPGVTSARAAGFLLARGVLAGSRIVVAIADGAGPFGESFARAAAPHAKVTVVRAAPIRVRGSSRPKAVVVAEKKKERELACDALVVDAPRAPAYELAEQAGGRVEHEARGFVVKAESSRIAERVWALGEMTGTAFDARAIAAEAERAAAAILA